MRGEGGGRGSPCESAFVGIHARGGNDAGGRFGQDDLGRKDKGTQHTVGGGEKGAGGLECYAAPQEVGGVEGGV